MKNVNEKFGATFTFGLVVRGNLAEIDALIAFLKASDLTVAHQQISQEKLWIKKDGEH